MNIRFCQCTRCRRKPLHSSIATLIL